MKVETIRIVDLCLVMVCFYVFQIVVV